MMVSIMVYHVVFVCLVIVLLLLRTYTMLYIERVTYDLGREMLRACAPI